VGDGSGAELQNKDKTEARRGRIFKTNEARWKAALEAAQAAAAAGSSAALPLVAAAQVASGSGEAAIATYQAAIASAPAGDDVAFTLSLASAQASAEKFPEAVATLDKLAAEKPKAALAAWKELTTAFPESPIKAVVEGRIVQLEIDLGIEANEGSGAKEGSGA
jgi:tetratricopeptide (TPR) repeat protein